MMLSDARGRPFADIMRDDVLRPIGMDNSTYDSRCRRRWTATPHAPIRATASQGARNGTCIPSWPRPPCGTTPSDLARFAIEVQRSAIGASNRVLSRMTVQEMLSPVGVGDFAVGFSISKIGQGWYFSHGGSNWGFRATLMAHKVKGYGLAIMTNADQGSAVASELSRRIQQAYEWDSVAEPAPRGYEPPVERTEIELPEGVLEGHVGEYQLNDEISVVVTLEDGRLQAEPTGQSKVTLYAEAEDRFFLRAVNAQVSFTRDEAGEVTALVLHQGGRDQSAPRVK